MQAKKKNGHNSQFPGRIKALRDATGLTQSAFAKAIGAARSMLAACESKDNPRRPSSALLISLGNIAAAHRRHDDAMWFWGRAGIALEGMLPAALEMLQEINVSVPVGAIASIPEWSSERSGKIPAMLFDSRLLRHPYGAKYLVPERGRAIIVDTLSRDVWELSGYEVAVIVKQPTSDHLQDLQHAFSGPELSKYSNLFMQASGPQIHWGLLTTSRQEDATVIVLESRNSLGLSQSHVLAIKIAGSRGHTATTIESPFFAMLGQVVAHIDLRGPLGEPHTREQFHQLLRKGKKGGTN